MGGLCSQTYSLLPRLVSFEKTTYCYRTRRLSVRLSSVEITSFRGNLISDMPIDLKIGLNVSYGVVHVRKA